jgi:hypothetical protein
LPQFFTRQGRKEKEKGERKKEMIEREEKGKEMEEPAQIALEELFERRRRVGLETNNNRVKFLVHLLLLITKNAL